MTVRRCSVSDCEQVHYGLGYCRKHWWRLRTHGAADFTKVRRDHSDTCELEGCVRPYSTAGLCQLHYARLRRHGDPTRGRPANGRPMRERLASKRVVTESGCHEWAGYVGPEGYGSLNDRQARRPRLVHILAYEIAHGPVPTGLQLDHLCRNRKCFNPEHLEPVTPGENVRRSWVTRRESKT